MAYDFPADIHDRLQARMNEGVYQSEDEVLRHAMDALDQLEQDKLLRWNQRNRLSQEQSEAGLSQPLNDQAVLGRLRKRLEADGIVD